MVTWVMIAMVYALWGYCSCGILWESCFATSRVVYVSSGVCISTYGFIGYMLSCLALVVSVGMSLAGYMH